MTLLNEDLDPVKVSTKTVWDEALLNYPMEAKAMMEGGLESGLDPDVIRSSIDSMTVEILK